MLCYTLKFSLEEPEEGGTTSRALYQAEKTKDLIMSFLTSQSDTQYVHVLYQWACICMTTRLFELLVCTLYNESDIYII